MRFLSLQSHVAYGYVGNRAATFPLQRLGHEVWAVNTVEFSNHTGYGAWRGRTAPADQVADIVAGIEALGMLSRCDALLTGYVGPGATTVIGLDTGGGALNVVSPTVVSYTVGGLPKRQSGCLVRTDAGLFFATRTRFLRRKRRPLTGKPVLVRTLLWLELRVPRQDGRGQERIALSRTLLPQVDRLRQALGAEDGGAVGAARLFSGFGGAPAETPPLGVA